MVDALARKSGKEVTVGAGLTSIKIRIPQI